MKNIAVAFLFISSFIWQNVVLAQSGQCGFIKDSNLQAQCRANSGGGSGQCGFIRSNDLQAMCRAMTGGGSSPCGFIRDTDMQAVCKAKFG